MILFPKALKFTSPLHTLKFFPKDLINFPPPPPEGGGTLYTPVKNTNEEGRFRRKEKKTILGACIRIRKKIIRIRIKIIRIHIKNRNDMDPYRNDMDPYRNDMESYQNDMDPYKNDMDT